MIGWMLHALDRSIDYFEDQSVDAQRSSVGLRRKGKEASPVSKVIGLANGVIVLFTLISCLTALLAGNVDKAITSLIVGGFLLAAGLTAYWLSNLLIIRTGFDRSPASTPESATKEDPTIAGGAVPTDLVDPASPGKAYDQAGREVLSGNYEPAIWAWALAQSGGNEKAAQAAYVQARVKRLQEDFAQKAQRLKELKQQTEQEAEARRSTERAKEQAEAERLQHSLGYKIGQRLAAWLRQQ